MHQVNTFPLLLCMVNGARGFSRANARSINEYGARGFSRAKTNSGTTRFVFEYWVRQNEDDPHDLDQIGLTLQRKDNSYIVAAVATQDGRPTVADVVPGDQLIRVGELDVSTATCGAIYDAMHGALGASRLLVVERNGERRTINATITRL